MKTKVVKIKEVKPNDQNPRFIRDDKFIKLVQSIKDFPEMLELRPIVVNEDMVVLGGNMRLKACAEAGIKELTVAIAEGLTEEQQREFIIKDNVGFGQWDFDILANQFEAIDLDAWGLDIPMTTEEEEPDNQPAKQNVTQVVVTCQSLEEAEKIVDHCIVLGWTASISIK
jgi:hypothetical protein